MVNEVFDRIYRDNLWNGVESRSGPGAGPAAAGTVAPAISELIDELGATSVLDVGCGDGYWMPDLPGYIGIDISDVAITMSSERHPDREYRIDGGPYPTCDLIISRCVMQHMVIDDALKMLDRFRASGARWLLATSYAGHQVNVGTTTEAISRGGGYRPNLTVAPFSLGDPIRSIPDPAGGEEGCTLSLWSLP